MTLPLWHMWPAHLYDMRGRYLRSLRVAAALPTLVADDGRVFVKKAVVDGIVRFHEADPLVRYERAILVDTYRQMDAAGW